MGMLMLDSCIKCWLLALIQPRNKLMLEKVRICHPASYDILGWL